MYSHWAEQVAALPLTVPNVHAPCGGQALGQDPSPVGIPESHRSDASTIPFPQFAGITLLVPVMLLLVLFWLLENVLFPEGPDFLAVSPQAPRPKNKIASARRLILPTSGSFRRSILTAFPVSLA